MCKILLIPGVKPERIKQTINFVQEMALLMSERNDDGLGYAAMKEDGSLFGERWLSNATAFSSEPPKLPRELARVANILPGMITIVEPTFEYNKFGNVDLNKMIAITLHTRYATSEKGLKNVHPFVDKQVSVIHNGVIKNDKDFNCTQSTCDSEAILVSYLNNKVSDINNASNMTSELDGYYACGILNGKLKVMDIFRGNGARLVFSYIKELDTFIYTTDKDDIIAACKALKYSHETIFEFRNEHILRLDAITGKLVMLNKIALYEAPKFDFEKYRQDRWGEIYNKKEKNMHPMMIEYMKKASSIEEVFDA